MKEVPDGVRSMYGTRSSRQTVLPEDRAPRRNLSAPSVLVGWADGTGRGREEHDNQGRCATWPRAGGASISWLRRADTGRKRAAKAAPANYYLTANGKRISGGSQVPEATVGCATTKKMPKPRTPQSSCTGEKFTAILAHAGEKRVALLYALNGGTWKFCDAGVF